MSDFIVASIIEKVIRSDISLYYPTKRVPCYQQAEVTSILSFKQMACVYHRFMLDWRSNNVHYSRKIAPNYCFQSLLKYDFRRLCLIASQPADELVQWRFCFIPNEYWQKDCHIAPAKGSIFQRYPIFSSYGIICINQSINLKVYSLVFWTLWFFKQKLGIHFQYSARQLRQ